MNDGTVYGMHAISRSHVIVMLDQENIMHYCLSI